MLDKVIVFSNGARDAGHTLGKKVISFFLEHGCTVMVPAGNEELTEVFPGVRVAEGKEASGCQLGIVLGGDGTMIQACHYLLGTEVPLIGVNLGHLGYMMEIEKEDIEPSLEMLLQEKFSVEKRLIMEAMVSEENGKQQHFYAVNDFLIHRDLRDGLIHLHAFLGDEKLTDFVSDGVIVSSPCGSTAYNFSAGGPIVSPVADNLIITPVCSHSMLDRSLVLSGSDVLKFYVEDFSRGEAAAFSCDGTTNVEIGKGTWVEVKKSDHSFRLAKLGTKSFYQIMKLKMRP